MVLAGDFNSVINSLDATGATHYSKTLHKLIHTLELQDAWDVHTAPRGFTHYTANAASRIDRIYITKHLLEQKQCVRKVAAPFTDHMAVILHLKTDLPLTTWGRGYWKLNMATVRDPATFETLKTKWTLWQRQRSQYNDILTWWTRFIKKQIKRYYTSIGTARRRDREQLENFYFSALYDVMKSDLPPGRMYDTINDLRRKINNLQNSDTGKFFSTSPEQALQTDEHPTLYHIIRLQKRKQSRHIGSIRDARNELHTTQAEISRTFLEDLTHRFETHNPDEAAKNHILEHITRRITDIDNIALLQPITKEELRTAVHNSPTNKSPGIDGISSDLYRHTWPLLHTDLLAVLNTMFTECRTAPQQTAGIIVNIPKKSAPTRTSDYRSLTLINADVKLLARVIANRMKMTISSTLHCSQHCGIPDRSIMDAVTKLRNIITTTEVTKESIYILSIDFKNAFDRVSHDFLFRTMEKQGYDERFIARINTLFVNTTSAASINGYISRQIPLLRSLRQGCPLSSILYAIYLDPLLRTIHSALTQNDTPSRRKRTTIIAYADDVSVILRTQHEATKVEEILRKYEKASGAEINRLKSKILKIGPSEQDIDIMDIRTQQTVKILGINFSATTHETTLNTWKPLVHTLRQQSCELYHRDLTLHQRINYVNNYLLAKLWYVAQFYSPPADIIRQVNTIISYFIWKGNIFRVPLSTLQKSKQEGGLALINPMAKSRTMCLLRIMEQCNKHENTTTELLRKCKVEIPSTNPPNQHKPLQRYTYLACAYYDSAYIPTRLPQESLTTHKKKMYAAIKAMIQDTNAMTTMRATKHWTHINWTIIWKNVWDAPVSERATSTWYEVIHDIKPTRQRLHAIKLAPSDTCTHCTEPDTIQHRLTKCGEAQTQWKWTQKKLALFLRTDPAYVSPEWLQRPCFNFWPRQKQRATLWILANYVYFRIQHGPTSTTQEYFDYLQRTRWKLYQTTNRMKLLGNYLSVLDPMGAPITTP